MKKRIISILLAIVLFCSGIPATSIVANAKNNGLTVKSSQGSDKEETDKKKNNLTVKPSTNSDDAFTSGDTEINDGSWDFDDEAGYNSYEDDYVELAGDGDTPIFSSDYLTEYTEKHDIDLPRQKKKSMMQKIIKKTSNPVYLTQKSSGQYLVTNDANNL